ncbi:hypothetical protein ACFQWC_07060 [Rossellomorea sp. GCM10028870]
MKNKIAPNKAEIECGKTKTDRIPPKINPRNVIRIRKESSPIKLY